MTNFPRSPHPLDLQLERTSSADVQDTEHITRTKPVIWGKWAGRNAPHFRMGHFAPHYPTWISLPNLILHKQFSQGKKKEITATCVLLFVLYTCRIDNFMNGISIPTSVLWVYRIMYVCVALQTMVARVIHTITSQGLSLGTLGNGKSPALY